MTSCRINLEVDRTCLTWLLYDMFIDVYITEGSVRWFDKSTFSARLYEGGTMQVLEHRHIENVQAEQQTDRRTDRQTDTNYNSA